MEGSVEDSGAPPESWEVADLDASMSQLMLSSSDKNSSSSLSTSNQSGNSALASAASASVASEDVINSVDQFLREALQNPRERLSVLRMEQDVEKFLRDPSRQQMEFQQLPTSYLRLAAHRVAQHYSLQSMVLLDNSLPDGSGSRIIVRKTSECWRPLIRLADVPVNLPTEETGVLKVAIKRRPQRQSQIISSANSHSKKSNSSKSVEERKEEYDRARARIFNSNVVGTSGKPESELRAHDNFQHSSLGLSKVEDKPTSGVSDMNIGRGLLDSSASSSRSAKVSIEREPFGRSKASNRVAVFRDREVDLKDPDYDRRYERYMQRFDPGFGFNGGPYTIQPLYSPALNYNTEFPQLGSSHRPSISAEHRPLPIPAHLSGPWPAPLTPAGIGYGRTESIMAPFTPNHVGPRPNSALYLQSTQYRCQPPGMSFVHPHEQVQLPFSQAHQQQPDTSFGLARPR